MVMRFGVNVFWVVLATLILFLPVNNALPVLINASSDAYVQSCQDITGATCGADNTTAFGNTDLKHVGWGWNQTISVTAGTCTGIASPCSTWNGNQLVCLSQVGCSYNLGSGKCTGTHAVCSTYTELQCPTQIACLWVAGATTQADYSQRTLAYFDLKCVPSNASLLSAQFTFTGNYSTPLNYTAPNGSLYNVSAKTLFTESTVTWNTQPAINNSNWSFGSPVLGAAGWGEGEQFLFTTSCTFGACDSILANLVSSWFNTSAGNYGVRINRTEANSDKNWTIFSHSANDTKNAGNFKPSISVDYDWLNPRVDSVYFNPANKSVFDSTIANYSYYFNVSEDGSQLNATMNLFGVNQTQPGVSGAVLTPQTCGATQYPYGFNFTFNTSNWGAGCNTGYIFTVDGGLHKTQQSFTYCIQPQNTTATLHLNGTAMNGGNKAYSWNENPFLNASAWANVSGLVVRLLFNTTGVANSTYAVMLNHSWAVGDWNVSAYAHGNANYTPSLTQGFANISKGDVNITEHLNGTFNNKTYTFPETVNATAWNNDSVSLVMRLNGTGVAVGTNPSNLNHTITAGVSYNFSSCYGGDANRTSACRDFLATGVSGSLNLTLHLNSSFADKVYSYGETVNASGFGNVSLAYRLLRNGTIVANSTTPTENNVSLTAGDYNYSIYYQGDANRSTAIRTFFANISRANVNLTLHLNGSFSDFAYTYPQTINASAWSNNVSGLTVRLLENGTIIANDTFANSTNKSRAVGDYNFTAYFQGNENYSTASRTFFANISKATWILGFTQNLSAQNLSGGYPLTSFLVCSSNDTNTLTLARNGTTVGTGAGVIYSETPYVASWEWNCSGGDQNYTSQNLLLYSFVSLGLKNLTIHLNGSNANFNLYTNETLNSTGMMNETGEGVLDLFANFTGAFLLLSSGVNPSNQSTNLSDGYYAVNLTLNATQNYSWASALLYANVSNATVPESVVLQTWFSNGSTYNNSNSTIFTGEWATFQGFCDSKTPVLNINGVRPNPFSANDWQESLSPYNVTVSCGTLNQTSFYLIVRGRDEALGGTYHPNPTGIGLILWNVGNAFSRANWLSVILMIVVMFIGRKKGWW